MMIDASREGKTVGFAAIAVYLKRLSLFALALILAGCINDDNSFRSLDLTATATLDDPVGTVAAKVMIIGDVASPRLADLLEVRGYDVTDVPYVSYEATAHAMSGDYIVWSDKRNGNFDIYAYQISTATEFPVSLAAGDQLVPQVSGDYVVWQDHRNDDADIYAYQISTATEFPITEINVEVEAKRQQRYPQIDGDYIVWQDERNNEPDIYAYQISSKTEIPVSIQTGDGEQLAPQIKDNTIIWRSYQGGFNDIHGYNIANGEQFVISDAVGSQYMPVMSDKYVVWVDNSSGDDNLYGFNLDTEESFLISAEAGQQWRPQVSGDYVVWQDNRGGDFDIYAYNLLTNSELHISAGDQSNAQQIYPVIDGDYIAWQDFRNDNYDIYAYRISTGEEIAISPHATPQTRPLLVDGQIAWLDGRRGLVDVFFRQQVSAVDQLATIEWQTPAGVTDDLSEQKLVILGSDVFSDEVVLDIFDTAISAKVNVLGFGGEDGSLASALATAERYGLSVTPASGCSPMRLVAKIDNASDVHAIFTDIDVENILELESDDAISQDELAITTDASDSDSPMDWNILANFSSRMCNQGAPAIVEFSTEDGGSKVILDGSAGVADEYAYWSNTRWSIFSNAVNYLTSQE